MAGVPVVFVFNKNNLDAFPQIRSRLTDRFREEGVSQNQGQIVGLPLNASFPFEKPCKGICCLLAFP